MRFSFKKALAAVLTVVFVLSAFVSTLAITSFAAEQVGTLTVANTTVDFPCNGEGKEFTVDAVVTLNSTKTYVEFAYEVTNIPTGVSLTSATVNEVEYLRPDGIVHVSIGGETTTFTIVMKFTATGTFDAFAPAINFFYADFDEVDSTLDTNVGSISAVVAGHTPAEAVKENEVPATCGAAGSYDSVVYCSICNDEISRETVTGDPATGHTDGELVNNGDDHSVKCSVCGEVIRTEQHDFSQGDCVCGAKKPATGPVLDENIIFNGEKIQISETLNAFVRVNKDLVSQYAAAEVVFSPTIYSSCNEVPGEPIVVNLFDETIDTSKNWVAYYNNFGMYMLGLEFTAQVKCYDAQGNYVAYSNISTYTPEKLLKDQFVNVAYDTATAAQKELNAIVTDMLNMGAKAQIYFAETKPNSDLATTVANGKLVNKWLDVDETIALPQAFATTALGELNTTENIAYKDGHNEETDSCLTILANLTGSPVLQFKYNRISTSFPDPSKLSLTVSYTKVRGGETVITDTVEGEEAWEALKVGKSYVYLFSKCALYDGNKTVTATLTYDGEVYSTAQYSLETYINQYKDDGSTMGDLLNAIGLFNVSARAYFDTL